VRRSGDLSLAVVFGALGALLAVLPGETLALRAPLAAPLVFVVPGYAATAALFTRPLDWAEWALLTPCLALAITVLGGLILNLTPWGLTAPSWAVLLLAVTVAASAVAAWRRRRAAIDRPLETPTRGPSLSTLQTLTVLGAALVAVGAVWLAREPVAQQPDQGYALLWTLPAASTGTSGVRVGVQNLQPAADRYDLRIVGGGQTLQQFSIDLQPTDSWEADITLARAGSGPVEALLYRAEAPDVVYRRAFLKAGT
jgi:hypothetical protein